MFSKYNLKLLYNFSKQISITIPNHLLFYSVIYYLNFQYK